MKLVWLLTIVLTLTGSLKAQQWPHNYTLKDVRVFNDTCRQEFTVIDQELKIKPKVRLTYYWYQQRRIFSNVGGIGGNVLDGYFRCYSVNGNLIEKGNFSKGLRIGKWYKWDTDGKLIAIENYKRGCLQGRSYYLHGNTMETKIYKNGMPRTKAEADPSKQDSSSKEKKIAKRKKVEKVQKEELTEEDVAHKKRQKRDKKVNEEPKTEHSDEN